MKGIDTMTNYEFYHINNENDLDLNLDLLRQVFGPE